MEKNNCHRCGAMTSGRFCGECGSRIVPEGKRDLVKEFFFIFADLEKRFVHTVKMMLVSPSTLIFAYIRDGERAKYFPPVRLLMITLIISYFWFKATQYLFIDGESMYEAMKVSFKNKLVGEEVGKVFSEENYKLFFDEFIYIMNLFYKSLNAISIPIATAVTMFFYKELKFNFVEHLIFNTFVICVQSFVIIVSTAVLLALPLNYFTFGYIGYIPMFLYSAYVLWDLGKESYKRPLTRAIGVSLLLIVTYSLVNMIFGMSVYFYVHSYVPDVFVPALPQ